MYHNLDNTLSHFQQFAPSKLFTGNVIGLEKESLRVASNGSISQTSHPQPLGAALTHSCITTDYSEALLEFVTPPKDDKSQLLEFLEDCQTFVYSKLEDEILWSASMPCVLAGEDSVPIAQYGSSNLGTMKTVYRRGLGLRYSKVMQVIAGVHFNFSFSDSFWDFYLTDKNLQNRKDLISDAYIKMIRNIQRFGWVIPYLFGSSPTVCKSFVDGMGTDMQTFDETTLYYPYATSLRMGDIGYQNSKEGESGIKVNYDSLSKYIESLRSAITTNYAPYESLGVKDQSGEYQQLNANLLQIENEYYSTVRPKQPGHVLEMPINALHDRGIKYIELRSLDINPLVPSGICPDTVKFLEVFMLFCFFQESPIISEEEKAEVSQNILDVAHKGREPGLMLKRKGESIGLKAWGLEIFTKLADIAELMAKDSEDKSYCEIVSQLKTRVDDPESTLSAKILNEMRENKEGFFQFSLRKSQEHFDYFKGKRLSAPQENYFQQMSRASLDKQKILESEDTMSFDEFLLGYFQYCHSKAS